MRNFFKRLFCNHNYMIIDMETKPNGTKIIKRMCTKCFDVGKTKI